MTLNYGFVSSLIKFFACVIMLISILAICVGIFLLSCSMLIMKLIGGSMVIAGAIFFIIAAYILIRVIIQYGNRKQG